MAGRLKQSILLSICLLLVSCSTVDLETDPIIISGEDTPVIIETGSVEKAANEFEQNTGSDEEYSLVVQEAQTTHPVPAATAKIVTPVYTNADINSEIIGINGFADNINPLTGMEVPDPQILNRRPVMIKVSNFPRGGRPHAGLSRADVVFEYYIGEEMNRFLAVYYGDNANHVGPLRSGRLIDPQLVNLYGGILVYGSADPKVDVVIDHKLDDRAITHLTATCPPICGTDTHSVSGVFVDSGELTRFVNRKGMDNFSPDNYGTLFDPTPPQESYFGVNIGTTYGRQTRGEWKYDPQSGQYLRWTEEKAASFGEFSMIPLVDRNNGEQIAFSNIIVLFSTYIEYAPTLHDVLVTANTHGQKALFYRDALMVEGSWKIIDKNTPIQFYNQFGLPYALKPGNTWIIFAGVSSTMAQVNDGTWEMQFRIP